MKLPRNISGKELVKRLGKLGYKPTRQIGSHIRLTTYEGGTHHLTIPNNDPIKIGTFSSIISDVAGHFKKDKDEILNTLFHE